MIGLDALFPELSQQETGLLKVCEGSRVPADAYLFREYYCVEKGCDCRRVILNVVALEAREVVATLNHALDPKALGFKDTGETCLEPFGPQSRHAGAILELFRNTLLEPGYVSRLREHYRQVKAAVEDPDHPIHQVIACVEAEQARGRVDRPTAPAPSADQKSRKIGRNEPCPCGSGRKYKRCCLRNAPRPEPALEPKPSQASESKPSQASESKPSQASESKPSQASELKPSQAWEPNWLAEVRLPPPTSPRRGTVELHPLVPRDLRQRLELARLQNLVFIRSLDQAGVFPAESEFPPSLHALFELEADCAEALWAMDQPQHTLHVARMVKDTQRTLSKLPAARSSVLGDLDHQQRHMFDVTALRVAQTVPPEECYSQVKGRDPWA